MTNEEYVEELYYIAHKCGVMGLFTKEVDNLIKSDGKSLSDATHHVFVKFKKEGIIQDE